jgi:hypothetical protein
MNTTQLKAMLASYGRSALAAGLALYMSGVTDPKTLAYSLLAAVAPVALRAINPSDKAFGRLPDAAEVDALLKTAKVVKKSPAKKTAVKKVAKKAAPKK